MTNSVARPSFEERRARRIVWELGPGKPSWLLGAGTTRAERWLIHLTSIAGGCWALWLARDAGWSWWQYALVAVLAYDLFGGVVANSSNALKRLYHGSLPPPHTPVRRLVHSEIGFAALHVQPIVLGVAVGAPWWWGVLWYAWALAGVAIVSRTPLYLTRPVGLLVAAAGFVVSLSLPSPAALAWLPVLLLLKLVVAHAIPEEPYAPVEVR